MDDVNKLLESDIKEKQRQRSYNRAKTGGKSGYKGRILLASDLLSKEERKEYQKPSKVKVVNMYDILDYEDFKLLSNEERKNHLEQWTKNYTVNEIAAKWGKTYKATYAHFNSLKVKIVKRDTNGRRGRPKTKNNSKKKPSKDFALIESNKPKETKVEKVVEKAPEKMDGFSFSLNGDYTAKELYSKMEKIGLILSDEDGKFKVELTVKELEETK